MDSGSIGSFISEGLAAKLECPQQECAAISFVTADVTPMQCTRRIQQLQWTTQQHTFLSNVGILPLKCFDMIVGEDWSEECSPM